jgi:hypothetical protein
LSTNINNFGHFLIDKLRILVPFLIFSQIGTLYAKILEPELAVFPCKGIVSLKSGAERELTFSSIDDDFLTLEGRNSEGQKKLMKLPIKMISKASCISDDFKRVSIYPKPKEEAKKLTKLFILTEPREAYVRLDTAEKFKQCPCTLDSMRHDKKYAFEARLNDKHFQWYREQYYTPKKKAMDTLYIKLKPSRPLWIIKTSPQGAGLFKSEDFSQNPLSYSPAQIEPKLPGYTQIHIHKEGYKDTVLNVSIPPFRPLISEINLQKINLASTENKDFKKEKWAKNLLTTSIPFFLLSFTSLYLSYESLTLIEENQSVSQINTIGGDNYQKLRKDQQSELKHLNQNLFIAASAGTLASLMLASGLYLKIDF